jgi:hypothetical protein
LRASHACENSVAPHHYACATATCAIAWHGGVWLPSAHTVPWWAGCAVHTVGCQACCVVCSCTCRSTMCGSNCNDEGFWEFTSATTARAIARSRRLPCTCWHASNGAGTAVRESCSQRLPAGVWVRQLLTDTVDWAGVAVGTSLCGPGVAVCIGASHSSPCSCNGNLHTWHAGKYVVFM